ncbi:TIR domain-containing protein [Zoogloea sp. G-4-1-14]|uniref:TIR domain-containing protein n=2 Tax=Zoogloea dura TaxID=2728840 RepID=A0A848GAW7_9RHOO|nr:TIR domain-containing protein [Zoogloea dura]
MLNSWLHDRGDNYLDARRKTGQPLLTIARDLRNRIELIKFESNPEEKIEELLNLGEQALDISLKIKNEISEKSEGSFHIAQMLAHRACILDSFSIQQAQTTEIKTSFETVKGAIIDELSLSFYDLAKLFCTGQRVKKGSRAPYLHVLNWLSQEQDWAINIRDALSRNPNHKQSVGQIIDRGHLRGHLNANPDLEEIVYYDDVSTILSIEDPKFYYYIKNISWSNFARNIGFPSIEFKFKYDFALSFAGTQRELAEELFKQLSANEITVFYDLNEQHRIIAESVESYLSPIYGSESRFVVALLSPDYPQRIWCKFESEQFKGRFGNNSVIPIWYPECFPGFFDTTSGVGGMSVDHSLPIPEQARKISETLASKIAETRFQDELKTPAGSAPS